MNQHAKVDIRHSTCPHDCPSACALDIEVIDGRSIGRVRGSKLQTYTAGVVCAKVARYAERIHHPDRLLHPMRRTGPKGSGQFARISWDEALDEIAARFDQAEREFGAQSVWPYYYAGTMGLVMRDGINRLAPSRARSLLPWAVGVQILAGLSNVLLSAPGWMQVVHLALANLVWLIFVWASLETLGRDRTPE